MSFFTRDVEATILFLTPKITASMHFIRYKVRGSTIDPPTQGDTRNYILWCVMFTFTEYIFVYKLLALTLPKLKTAVSQ